MTVAAGGERQPVATVRWRDGCVELIDQRLLPQRLEYVQCRDAAAVATAIRDLAVRGAPAIGCAAAYGVAVEAARLSAEPAGFAAALEDGFALLAASRPTAVNLFWALARMRERLKQAQSKPPAEIAARRWTKRTRCWTRTFAPTAPWATTARPCCATASAC